MAREKDLTVTEKRKMEQRHKTVVLLLLLSSKGSPSNQKEENAAVYTVKSALFQGSFVCSVFSVLF